MKPSWEDDYKMPAEFDFSQMKRIPNPFQQTFKDLHLVSLDEDIADVFPSSEAVNMALRAWIQATKEQRVLTRELKKAS